MDQVIAASTQDVVRRLRQAGDEHWDLRCVIYHKIDELSWENLEYQFGAVFGKSSFRPLANEREAWNIIHYHDSELDRFRVYRKVRPALEESPERAKRLEMIWRKLESLTADAFWLANDLGMSRIPGIERFDARQILRNYSSWMWLVFNAAWACPAGSILRAGKYYPVNLVTRIKVEKLQAEAVGVDPSKGTLSEFSKSRKAIAERKRSMTIREREAEWFTVQNEVEKNAKQLFEDGQYMSVLPLDPFTASAALLELLAFTPLSSPIKVFGNALPEQPVPSIVLNGPGRPVCIYGDDRPALTDPQYNVVQSLLEAGQEGLNKDELVAKSGHSDARGILTRLAKDSAWQTVISFPGKPGGKYRIHTNPH